MTGLEASGVVVAIGTGVAAGLVGCFAVMRRMTLAADAISHIALPGIGVAVLLHVHAMLGGLAALLLGALIVWTLEQRTRLSTETVIGVVFSMALAAGSLLASGDELIEALFGGSGSFTMAETVAGLVVATVVVAFVLYERHRLVLALISPEMARTAGIDVARLNLHFLIVFALTIALGLRYLGVLLIGSLAIIPAATAKRLAGNLNSMLTIAVAVSVFTTLAGTYAAHLLHREAGPLVVLFAGACFVLSLFSRGRGRVR
jgi:ABC-type Mn2+/Zn2+ transport system permease subunit